jgi:uncharacterized protein
MREAAMRVLVTGATGFIGRRLCDRLAQAGHRVVALSRDPDAAAARLPGIERAFGLPAAGGELPDAAFAGVDAVVHLAGETVSGRWTTARRQAIETTRTAGTAAVVRAIARGAPPPRVLVCASATGYYGDRGEETLIEESLPGRGFLAEVCRAWETEAARAEAFGTRVVRLRTGIVLDPAGGALASMRSLFRAGLGGPLGSGRQWWAWIGMEDLVALYALSLDRDWSGAVNAVAPEPVRQRDFARGLGRTLGRPARLPAPAFALRLVLGGFASELLSSRRVEPRAALRHAFTFRAPRLGDALPPLR